MENVFFNYTKQTKKKKYDTVLYWGYGKDQIRYALRIKLVFCSLNNTKEYDSQLHFMTGQLTVIKVQKTEVILTEGEAKLK